MRETFLRLAVLSLVLFVAATAAAQDEAMPTNVVHQVVEVRPLPGHGAAFEAGIKVYMAWALEAGNDWRWSAFEVIAGEDTGAYSFGTYAHEWSDFDDPPVDPAATGAALDEHVSPHVRDVVTTFGVSRPDLSNYSRSVPAPLYMVFEYQVKNGEMPRFEAAMKRYHDAIVENAPDMEYIVFQTVVGAVAGSYRLAVPLDGMADMASMPNLDAMMQEAIGSWAWQELTSQYFASIQWETSGMIAYRPDLSLNPAQ